MKIVVFGDIHGRDIWEKIVEKEENVDRYIFLGDYVSTHEKNVTSKQQIDNLKKILDFAKCKNKEKSKSVILLRGNHDMQHLGYYWAKCCSFDYEVQKEMMRIRNKFLKNTQWVYLEDNIVYSHAGVSDVWMKANNLTDINQINELEPSEKFGFTPCKFSDYCGESVTQPPTWIRPWALLGSCFGDYTYIVGHTSYKKIINVKEEAINSYKESYIEFGEKPDENVIKEYETYNDIWACDCLGYGEYVVVEDGNIKVRKI